MGRAEDLVGRDFGGLVVVARADNRGHRAAWLCECVVCERRAEYLAQNLRAGRSRCVCRRRKADFDVEIHDDATAEQRGLREYRLWWQILGRCHNVNDRDHKDYGGRGIYVCERWRTFSTFLGDIGSHPEGKYVLALLGDHYGPDTSQWMTPSERARRRSNNRLVEINGVERPLVEWVEESGQNYGIVSHRLDAGHAPEAALSVPVGEIRDGYVMPRSVDHDGVEYPSLAALARSLDLNRHTLRVRLRRGWTLGEAVKPSQPSHRSGECNGLRYSSWVELARAYGLNPKTLYSRIQGGMTIEDAVARPAVPPRRPVEYGGVAYATITDLARATGLTPKLLSDRLNRGWTVAEAVETPVGGTRRPAV